MIIDDGLRLATSESVPNQGASPGGIGETSANLELDPSGITAILRNYADIGGGHQLCLALNIEQEYLSGTFGSTLEIQLVSIPVRALRLDDGSGGAGDGKLLQISGVSVQEVPDTLTIALHGFPLGAPIYFSDVGTSGLTANQIYYVIPVSQDTFQVADSLADALAGASVGLAASGALTLELIPTIHGSTGALQLFNAGTPTNQGILRTGTRMEIPVGRAMHLSPRQAPAFRDSTDLSAPIPIRDLSEPLGAGPTTGYLAGNAQQYYYLRYIPSATITQGTLTCDIVLTAGDALKFHASGFEAKT